MTSFDRAEERNEELLHHENWLSREVLDEEPDPDRYGDAYELDDPKHETFHERYADFADMDAAA